MALERLAAGQESGPLKGHPKEYLQGCEGLPGTSACLLASSDASIAADLSFWGMFACNAQCDAREHVPRAGVPHLTLREEILQLATAKP